MHFYVTLSYLHVSELINVTRTHRTFMNANSNPKDVESFRARTIFIVPFVLKYNLSCSHLPLDCST